MPTRRPETMSWPERLLFVAALLLFPVCLYVIFAVVPTERTMGVVQRIFYFHVPSALAAFLAVGLCALFSALYLWRRERRHDLLAHASAELAVLFCAIVLITGPIWARPVWNVWWPRYDAQLTSTLILLLIYVGYLVLRQSAENPEQAARWAAVVGIIGALDIPIIYKSIEWFGGHHRKVLKISGGGGLDHPLMRIGLLLCFCAFLALFGYLLLQRYRLGQLQDEIEVLEYSVRPKASGSETSPARGGI